MRNVLPIVVEAFYWTSNDFDDLDLIRRGRRMPSVNDPTPEGNTPVVPKESSEAVDEQEGSICCRVWMPVAIIVLFPVVVFGVLWVISIM